MRSILWLTENYPPQRGGMAQSCDRIIHGLRSVGFEIEIIHFTNKRVGKLQRKQQKGGGYTAIEFTESEAHTLNLAWNHIKTLEKFDYLACFGGYLSMIGAPLFSKWKETPLITFLRGNDFDVSVFVPRKRKILEDALSQSKFVFSVSGDKVGKVKKWLPHSNPHFVANGIELGTWQPAQSELDFAKAFREENYQNRLCFGVFGQLKAKKGLKFLINSLQKTSLLSELHLILVGDVEECLLEEIVESEISHTSISFQDRFELLKYYLCCDALVIPSFYEGMPNVMLEAGALGIPVLASEVDGMADVIEHKQDGFLFPPGNEDLCRRAFYDFFALSEKERLEMGQQLKEKIITKYTAQHETENYRKILV
ncbi:MAG: glycogen(starch) synthase [Arenicella sp.]|jgi:glycogen(starch) synthase